MDNLPCELINKIFDCCVGHFRDLVGLGAVCRAWKKVSDSSFLWFSLELKYQAPCDFKTTILKYRSTSVEDSIKLGHPQLWQVSLNHAGRSPPSSLPLNIRTFVFLFEQDKNHPKTQATAKEYRNWFMSYLIYHKKIWKWYVDWISFFEYIDKIANCRKFEVFLLSALPWLLLSFPGFKDNFFGFYGQLFLSFFHVAGILLYFCLAITQLVAIYYLHHTEFLNRFWSIEEICS
jgi:hypothetical protein